MRYTLLLFAAVVAASVAPSITWADDIREPSGYWTGPINSAVPATLTGGQVIHARELTDLLKRSAAVVVDVSNAPKRPEGMSADAPWLPLPHESIPGSAWIPGAGMSEISAEIDACFREHLSLRTQRNPDHPVVIYCHEKCWLSWNAAKRAIHYGYRRVYWFPEGIEGWRAAGFKTEVVGEETADR